MTWREVIRQVEEMPSETTDSTIGMQVYGASHWVGRAEVLALLSEAENDVNRRGILDRRPDVDR